MKVLSNVLVALFIMTGSIMTAQVQAVILINEVPTAVTLDGEEITAIGKVSNAYMAEFSSTPKHIESFKKTELILDSRPVIVSKALAQTTVSRTIPRTNNSRIKQEILSDSQE